MKITSKTLGQRLWLIMSPLRPCHLTATMVMYVALLTKQTIVVLKFSTVRSVNCSAEIE